jgi:hypothetical protein
VGEIFVLILVVRARRWVVRALRPVRMLCMGRSGRAVGAGDAEVMVGGGVAWMGRMSVWRGLMGLGDLRSKRRYVRARLR